MASVFLGNNDRTFTYSFTAGREEYEGSGFRSPMDFALAPDDIIYAVNRSNEARNSAGAGQCFQVGRRRRRVHQRVRLLW